MDLFKKAKQRIFRGYFRLGAHIHVRHWRGHGIHSPFMYGIVRNVFMKSKITGPDTRLYDELRRERIGRKPSRYRTCTRIAGWRAIRWSPDSALRPAQGAIFAY